jgi:hypothetical protein
MRKTLLATTAAVAGTLIAASAYAAPFVIEFADGPLGDLGGSFTWAASGATVTATAIGAGSPDLWAESNGPDETGIGETKSPYGDNEISTGRFVQLAVSGGSIDSLTLSSTDPHDTGEIFGSDTPGALGTLLGTSDSHAPFTLAPGFLFYDVTALPLALQPVGSNDTILVGSVSGEAIPASEPGTLPLLGMALLGFGLLWARTPRAKAPL